MKEQLDTSIKRAIERRKIQFVAEHRTEMLRQVFDKVKSDGGTPKQIEALGRKLSKFINEEFKEESAHVLCLACYWVADILCSETFDFESDLEENK